MGGGGANMGGGGKRAIIWSKRTDFFYLNVFPVVFKVRALWWRLRSQTWIVIIVLQICVINNINDKTR